MRAFRHELRHCRFYRPAAGPTPVYLQLLCFRVAQPSYLISCTLLCFQFPVTFLQRPTSPGYLVFAIILAYNLGRLFPAISLRKRKWIVAGISIAVFALHFSSSEEGAEQGGSPATALMC